VDVDGEPGQAGTHGGGEADDEGARVSRLELELHFVDAEVVERVDVAAQVKLEGVEDPVDIEEEAGTIRLGRGHGGHSVTTSLYCSLKHTLEKEALTVAISQLF
jgi:hypothetical protein